MKPDTVKMAPLTVETINTEGAIRLVQKVFEDTAQEYINAYCDLLKAEESENPYKIKDTKQVVYRLERWIRKSVLIQAIIDNIDDVIPTLQSKARQKYVQRADKKKPKRRRRKKKCEE